jgi:nucleoside phosphorylase/ADP-ribose pyrophosphatase YjhB (NUDIX family)
MKKRLVVIVPLLEELSVFFSLFARTQTEPHAAPGLSYWTLAATHPDLEVFVTGLEEMGNEPALLTAIDCINYFQPNLIICAGIGGSLVSDFLLGDVAIAKEVKGISDATKIVDKGAKGIELRLSDRGFRPADELVEVCAHLPVAKPDVYHHWQDMCARYLTDNLHLSPSNIIPAAGTPPTTAIARPRPEIQRTCFASGYVVAADNFPLRSSRETGIVETEGAGIGRACQRRGRKVPFMVFRGISDYADSRKNLLEGASKDRWRQYAKYTVYSLIQTVLSYEPFVKAIEAGPPIPSKCTLPDLVAPRVEGRFAVLVFLLDAKNRLLLVQHPFHKRLIPPGGRLNDGEVPHDAIKRRVLEETGLTAFEFHPCFHRPLRVISELVEDVPGPYSVHMEHRRQRDEVMFHYAFVYICRVPDSANTSLKDSNYKPQWYTLDEIRAMPRDTIPFDDIIRRYEDVLATLARTKQAKES